ncbi:MAG: OmpH family outer membrane protein [Acidobacteriota bacterium]
MRISAVTKLMTALPVVLGLAAGVLMAQTPTKIGTINLQQAVTNTAEAKAATAKLQREFVEPRTKQLEGVQQEIRELQEKLQRGGNTLSQAAKDELQLSINRKTRDFNRSVEDYQADSDDKQRELLADFSTKMQDVIAAYSKEGNFAAIWDTASRDSSGLVIASPLIDVTQDIVAAYDKAHPVTGGAAAAPSPAASKPSTSPVKPAAPKPAPVK